MGEERLSEVVQVLTQLAEIRHRIDVLEHAIVAVARSYGATWEDIGEQFGISRQAARQRFGEPRKRQR